MNALAVRECRRQASPARAMAVLDAKLAGALRAHDDVDAFGCVDLRNGALLGGSARGSGSREALEIAVLASTQLGTPPRLGAPLVDDDGSEHARTHAALVVAESALHAFAFPSRHPRLAIVAIARGNRNAGLLLASVRSVADGLNDEDLE